MRNSLYKIIIFSALFYGGLNVPLTAQKYQVTDAGSTLEGAENMVEYLPLIEGKRVAIVANHTSVVGKVHLVDTLLSLNINVTKVFAPEHGFRGMADAGEKINTSIDEKTGLPIISLYGKNKKPTADQLKDVDVVLFDIQDVGARFYTYISTMTYVMEASAENEKKIIVLDRPNPNGYYVDGPIMQSSLKSFVGMHPVPIIHGMTIGEYAQMVNGEKWMLNGVQCDLTVIPIKNYDHLTLYQIPIAPSPNLKSMASIYLYPSLCLFEGTEMSVGRGTDDPFTMVGHPSLKGFDYSFTPTSHPGATKPKYENQKCFGINYPEKYGTNELIKSFRVDWIIDMYKAYPSKDDFFTNFFNQLIGNTTIKQDIIAGKSSGDIQATWKNELAEFKKIRKKYLIYPDFED